ncbi:hypothetical protein C5167_004472, partial [Papaver somniferum]
VLLLMIENEDFDVAIRDCFPNHYSRKAGRESFKEREVCGIWMNKEVDRYGGKKMKQGIRRTH